MRSGATLLAAVVLALSSAGAASAQSCPAKPNPAKPCPAPTATPTPTAATTPTAESVLARVRSVYEGLKNYADSGVVVTEDRSIGSNVTTTEKHGFTTIYAAPRSFKFDYKKENGERYVVWSPGDSFNTWWSATGVTENFPPGQGSNSFAVATLPTSDTILLIAPLLFQAAQLEGPLVIMAEPKLMGSEVLAGHKTWKLTANVQLNHWGDHTRPTTIWVDAESGLVRKVVEDTPSGMGGAIERITTTIDPHADTPQPPKAFVFSPPK